MRWLKSLVIGMGIVIVIGLTVVIIKVAQQAGEPSVSVVSDPASPAPPVIGARIPAPMVALPPMPGNIDIAIPAGAIAEDIVMEQGRLIVRLRLSDGRARFLMIDMATGKKLGTVTLDNRPKTKGR
jgi:hypothetical protein